MRLISRDDEKWLQDSNNHLFFELMVSYLEARKGGKRATFDEHKFEVNLFLNLKNIFEAMLKREYKPCRGTAHVIFNPVIREIFAACFKDRIVHHWVYLKIVDFWDRRFIYDSYSCREGKGTKFGIEQLQHHIRAVSRGEKGNSNRESDFAAAL